MSSPTTACREEHPQLDLRSLRQVRFQDYAVRFAFGAVVSAVAALIGLIGGDRLGGLFLAFPAILPATLTLLQKEDGRTQAVKDAQGATLGSIGMVAFAVTAVLLGRAAGWALVAALGAWAGLSLALYGFPALLVRRRREQAHTSG
jgi:hypothetical protein